MGFKVIFKCKKFFNISDEQEGVIKVAAVDFRFEQKPLGMLPFLEYPCNI